MTEERQSTASLTPFPLDKDGYPDEYGHIPYSYIKKYKISIEEWRKYNALARERYLKTVEHEAICPWCHRLIGHREVVVGGLVVCPYCRKTLGTYRASSGGFSGGYSP